jgi:hypothetical protein
MAGGQSTSVPFRACSREGPPSVNDLQDGPEYKFADWIRRNVPSKTIAVYTIWRSADFLYVGMSTDLPTRLNAHASGRRSGDQFNVYICDRLVVPGLTLEQLRDIERGDLFLDRMTKDYVRQKLTYRYVVCQDKAEAEALERAIRSGRLPAGRPFLNPLR